MISITMNTKQPQLRQCVKCGEHGPHNIKYHVGHGTICMGDEPGPRCGLYDIHTDNTEHLHVYCRCGYDWTGDIVDIHAII